jgi:hypothetical protein
MMIARLSCAFEFSRTSQKSKVTIGDDRVGAEPGRQSRESRGILREHNLK